MTKAEVLMTGPMMPLVMERAEALFDPAPALGGARPGRVPARGRPAHPRHRRRAAAHRRDRRGVLRRAAEPRDRRELRRRLRQRRRGEAAERGIVVTNTPDVLNEEVADSTLGLLLATVRQASAGRPLPARREVARRRRIRSRATLREPQGRHRRPRPDRQGDRPAARGLRRRGRLSRPHPAGGRALPLSSDARRPGGGRRHADRHHSRRRRDASISSTRRS